jgi:Restriction endonuclease NaeI
VINEPLFRVPSDDPDAELDAVEAELYRLDPTGDQVAMVLRDTLDQLYDGQRTGRWTYDQLHKTEKTYMGTLVEINLHRQFGFDDGNATDYGSRASRLTASTP